MFFLKLNTLCAAEISLAFFLGVVARTVLGVADLIAGTDMI